MAVGSLPASSPDARKFLLHYEDEESESSLVDSDADVESNVGGLGHVDCEQMHQLEEDVCRLQEKVSKAEEQLEDMNTAWQDRRQPYLESLEALQEELGATESSLTEARRPEPQGPGPECVSWVDTQAFEVLCGCVVTLNLLVIYLRVQQLVPDSLNFLDHVFLAWYVFELLVKFVYFRSRLFIGSLSSVALNWLDLGIVAGGVLLQWLIPLVFGSGVRLSSFLGALRCFRLLRILKLISLVLSGDLSWTEGPTFQMFMTIVIATNALLMSFEMDFSGWDGWFWINNTFLAIYGFELAVKMKYQGCAFFYGGCCFRYKNFGFHCTPELYNAELLFWNYLDSLIVLGGGFDLVQSVFQSGTQRKGANPIIKLLRLMRLLRILRLVKLMKAIKPLYRLLSGVIESMRAIQWVMVLSLLMLYAMALVWRSLFGKEGVLAVPEKATVGRGDGDDDEPDPFGTVIESLFSLFKIMNGDFACAEDVLEGAIGKIIFVVFMVTSNWAILAILTSVVSDNMITSSLRAEEEEESVKKVETLDIQARRLCTLFEEFDQEGDGIITHLEWAEIMENAGMCHELCEASGCGKEELVEIFRDLSVDSLKVAASTTKSGRLIHLPGGRCMYYDKFIKFIRTKYEPANQLNMVNLLARVDRLEAELAKAHNLR